MRCSDIGVRASGERYACFRGVNWTAVGGAGAGVGGDGKSTLGPDFMRMLDSSSSSSWKRESNGASYVTRFPRLPESMEIVRDDGRESMNRG